MLTGAFSLGNAAPNVQSFSVARGAAYIDYNLIELVRLTGAFSLRNTAPNVQSFSVARGAAYIVYNLIELVSVDRSIISWKCSPKCAEFQSCKRGSLHCL